MSHCKFREFKNGTALVSVGGVDLSVPHKHTDERRTIYERWVDSIGLVQVLHVLSDSAGPLGVHFHRYTEENFMLADGCGAVLLASVDKNEQRTSEIKRQQLSVGDSLKMKLWTAHAFLLEPGSVLTCIASHKYDPDDAVRTQWLIE